MSIHTQMQGAWHAVDLAVIFLQRNFPKISSKTVRGMLDVVERDRKIDVVVLVWTLVVGWFASAKRTIVSLRRSFVWAAGHTIARSSFYQRLGWQIEILSKQLRSHNRLDEVPSSKEHVAEILLNASMIALLVSRALLRELRTKDRSEFYPEQRFQAVFEAYGQPAVGTVTKPRRRTSLSISG